MSKSSHRIYAAAALQQLMARINTGRNAPFRNRKEMVALAHEIATSMVEEEPSEFLHTGDPTRAELENQIDNLRDVAQINSRNIVEYKTKHEESQRHIAYLEQRIIDLNSWKPFPEFKPIGTRLYLCKVSTGLKLNTPLMEIIMWYNPTQKFETSKTVVEWFEIPS
jgi:hypothetical protein